MLIELAHLLTNYIQITTFTLMKNLFRIACSIVLICIGPYLYSSSILFDESLCPDPPSNDDPCFSSVNPPQNLIEGVSYQGSTCCARGPQDSNTDGTPADHPNFGCSSATEGAAVWYVFTPNEADDGYDITLEEVVGLDQAEGPITIEVYWASEEDACMGNLNEPLAFSCVATSTTIKIGNCPGPDQMLFVKVSTASADDNCGDFQLTITKGACTIINGVLTSTANICEEITEVLYTNTDTVFNINYEAHQGCLDYACPSADSIGGCDAFTTMPTVWFKVITDESAQQLFTTVEAFGNWKPIWAIYSGNDCNNLSVVTLGGALPCSNQDITPEVHQVVVVNNINTYWIAVSADPNYILDSGIENGSFELSIASTINALICIGDDLGDCNDETLIIEIVQRDNEGESLDGPFCQGEEVTVSIHFDYDASESGADWLAGFVPLFGEGWDLESFDFAENVPLGNAMPGVWYEEGTALGPIIQETVPILCTYRDENGVLKICNQLCELCDECDQQGLDAGDPLPSGYFWVTNGGNAGCDNDGSPGEGWGIGSINASIEWTFKIKTKTFETEEECLQKGDLRIGFQTFSDGVAGCWEDPVGECLLDRSMLGPNWNIGCTELPPEVVAEDVTICSGETLNINVATIDGSLNTIAVKKVNNLFVSGENDVVFFDGFGIINDQITNLTTETQILQYGVYSVDDALFCDGVKNVINVTVLPSAQLETSYICSCDNGCTAISVDSVAGFSYSFYQEGILLSEGTEIEVCPENATIYEIVASHTSGCTENSFVTVDCEGVSDYCMEQGQFKIQYSFFIDEDLNGTKDSAEIYIAAGNFEITQSGIIIYNTLAGESDLFLDEGTYSFAYQSEYFADWFLTTDSMIDVELDSMNNCVKVSFGVSPVEPVKQVNTYYNLFQLCNSERAFSIYARNFGNYDISGIFWAEIDEEVMKNDFFDVNEVDTIVLPNKMGWYFSDLSSFNIINKKLTIHIPGPPDFPIGGLLNYKLYTEVFNADGTKEIVGETNIDIPVLCAYDPNDKQVDPHHPEGYTNITDSELTYKVRFQNVGNAPAMNIEIKDTLSEYLDVSSVRYLSGSHDEFLSFSRSEENILTFKFSNINLPDSLSDPLGSQGYLIYSVHVIDNLPEGTIIENTAHIYFDFNPAIVTNTTTNILYDDLDADGFYSIEDCNDSEALINPDAEEIPNNEVDEDCDGEALIIDDDMDGFNSDEDCDDQNAAINPDAEEIINNSVDEDCDGLAVVIDNDNDGFNSDEDCDDQNADINPDAVEIPDNGIDEDCDGVDDITDSVKDYNPFGVQIFPNPTTNEFSIKVDRSFSDLKYTIYDTNGKVKDYGGIKNNGTIDLKENPSGLYFIKVSDDKTNDHSFFKLIKM
ncbi:MAG: putative repeat protein (TIGR01451 family) [Saprospiraceae bacterium]|jgi:uncharacterized repeat protein (TIGR01451 family)